MSLHLLTVYKCPLCPEREGMVSIDPDAWLSRVAQHPDVKGPGGSIQIELAAKIKPASRIVFFNRGIGPQRPCQHIVDIYFEASLIDASGDFASAELDFKWSHPWFKRCDKDRSIHNFMWEMDTSDVRPEEHYEFERVQHSWKLAFSEHEMVIDGDFKVALDASKFLRQLRKCAQRLWVGAT